MAVFATGAGVDVGVGVGDGVAGADGRTGGADGDPVPAGDGLAGDAHATTSTATTIDVAIGESEERINCPPDTVAERHPVALACCVSNPVGLPTH